MDFSNAVNLDMQDRISGIYPTIEAGEATFASGTVTLQVENKVNTFEFSGYTPLYTQEEVSLNHLDIYVNGELIDTVEIEEEMPFTYTRDISEYRVGEENYRIEIVADYTYVPAKLGLGEDERELAYTIHYIGGTQ